MSSAALVCRVPKWTLSACTTTLRVRQGSVTLPGNATFSVIPAWDGIDPPSGPTLGGTAVVIRGAGFSDERSYQCLFSETGVMQKTSPAAFLSATSLSCTSPSWPQAVVTTVILRDDSGGSLPIIGRQAVLFAYTSDAFWTSASPTFGGAQGGYNLTVVGNLFDPAASDYFVIMVGTDAYGATRDLVAQCYPESESALHCLLPSWEYGEASVRLDLMKGDASVSKIGGAMAFTFTSYWTRISTPTYGARESGTLVTIAGNAFFPTTSNLRCRWIGSTGDSPAPGTLPPGQLAECNAPEDCTKTYCYCKDTVASVSVSTQVECAAPVWFLHEQNVTLSIFSLEAGQEKFAEFTGHSRDQAVFRYVASWSRADTLFVTSRPWPSVERSFFLSPLGGGSTVTITGAGFDRDNGFGQTCRFTRVASGRDGCGGLAQDPCVYASATLQAVNSTLAYCMTPSWPHAVGSSASVKTILSLVHSDSLPLYHDVSDHFHIMFTRAWVVGIYGSPHATLSAAQGPADGGSEVTILGSRFCNLNESSQCDNSYKCEFLQPNDNTKTRFSRQCKQGIDAGATCEDDRDCSSRLCTAQVMHTSIGSRIINDTHLVCMTPSWPYPPTTTQIILYDSSFGGEDMPIAAFEETTFEFVAVAQTLSPSQVTARGANLTFHGTGFVSYTLYTCRLHFPTESQVVQAVFVSATELTCLAPELPSGQIATDVSVSFLDRAEGSTYVLSNDLSITYRPLWRGFSRCVVAGEGICSNSSGPATGNFSLVLSSLGLDPASLYEIRFRSTESHEIAAPLRNSSAEGDFFVDVPLWGGAAGTTFVSLHEMMGSDWFEIQLDSKYLSEVSFTFLAALMAVPAGPYPRAGCGSDCWPVVVHAEGGGFIPTFGVSPHYSCVLTRLVGNQSVSSSSVEVWPNTDVVKCTFGISTTPPEYVSGEYSLSVMYQGELVSIPGGPIHLFLREAWVAAVCPPGGCAGPASGNSVVGVMGFGFSASKSYRCLFDSVLSDVALFISTQYIECKTPMWTSTPREVNISLQDGAGATLAYDGRENVAARFRYLASWWLPPSAQYASIYGPAHGDRTVDSIFVSSNLTIAGIGFLHSNESNVTYFAELSGVDYDGRKLQRQSNRTRAISDTKIQVPFIPWNGPSGHIQVQLFQCSSSSACFPIRIDPGASVAHPSEIVVSTVVMLASTEKVFFDKLENAHYEDHCFPFGPVRCWGSSCGGQALKVVGDGFDPYSNEYNCRFSDSSNPTLYVDSDAASVVNAREILCVTPKWPYGAGLVSISVVWNDTRLPQHVRRETTLFYFESCLTQSATGHGSASADVVVLEGVSLQNASDILDCVFSATDSSGFEWLPNYKVRASAISITRDQLACNISGRWGAQYPGVVSQVHLMRKHSSVPLLFDLSRTGVDLNFNESNRMLDDFRALHMEVGTYLMVDDEIMLVTDVPNEYAVTVTRAQRGTTSTVHLLGTPIGVLLPTASPSTHDLHTFLPAYTGINIRQSLASGGQALTADISGMTSTYLEHTTTLSAYPTSENRSRAPLPQQFKESPIDQGADTGLMYWGVAFDVFAHRSIRVSALDFTALKPGDQKLWIFKRKLSSCPSPSCGTWGFDLMFDSWELVGRTDNHSGRVSGLYEGFDVTVDSTLRSTIEIDSIRISGGATLGFLIVADKGIRFSKSNEPGYECIPGPAQRCKQWSDEFVSIRPGKIILSQVIFPSIYPNAFVDSEGQESDPIFYAGKLTYTNEEVSGADYRCKFTLHSPSGLKTAESLPTKAFSDSVLRLQASQRLTCLIPVWEYGHSITNFSLVSADEEILLDAQGFEQVEFRYTWSRLDGPKLIAASGGRSLFVHGYGFYALWEFYCVFNSTKGSYEARSLATIVNASTLECFSPVWEAPSQEARFDIVACTGLITNCEVLSWSPSVSTEEYTVGTLGSTVCSGWECLQGGLFSPSCLEYPCISEPRNEFSGYQGRTFQFEDVFTRVEPQNAPAGGGTLLTISGNGFIPTDTYLAHFLNGNRSYIAKSGKCSTSNITFISPRWGERFAGVSHLNDLGTLSGSLQLFRLELVGSVLSFSNGSIGISGTGFHEQGGGLAMVGDELILLGPAVINGNQTLLAVVGRGLLGTISAEPYSGTEDLALLHRIQAAPGILRDEMDFDFVAMWNVNQTSFDPLSSTISINISGAGFKRNTRYYLELNAGDTTEASTLSYAELTKIVFEPVLWSHGVDIPAKVTLLSENGLPVCQSGELANCFPRDLFVVFNHSWHTIDTKSGYAQGGALLTVRGSGFEVGSSAYSCSFSFNSTYEHHVEIVNANVTLPTELVCVTPHWDFRADKAVVSVQNGQNDIPYIGLNHSDSIFEFIESWDSILSDGRQAQGPARGTTLIVVAGGGFDMSSDSYYSVFSFGLFAMNSSCLVHSSSRLHCITPEWGLKYPHKKADVNIVKREVRQWETCVDDPAWTFHDMPTGQHLDCAAFSVLVDGASDDDLDDFCLVPDMASGNTGYDACCVCGMRSSTTIQTIDRTLENVGCSSPPCGACNGQVGCSFDFKAVADGFEASSPKKATAQAGINVTLLTYGLDTSAQYYCNFTSGSVWVASRPTQPLSSDLFVCNVPTWPHISQVVHVVVHKTQDELVMQSVPALFTYVDGWYGRNPAVSAARRKQQIHIYGYGFDASAEYSCSFTSTNVQIIVSADVLSLNTIVCESPVWEHGASSADLTLMKGQTEVTHTGDAATASFTFLAGWDARDRDDLASIGPASGGNNLIFVGYGFDHSASYLCMFARDGKHINSTAMVLSNRQLSCPTPAWGLYFEDSWGAGSSYGTVPPERPVSLSIYSDTFQHLIPKTDVVSLGPLSAVGGLSGGLDESFCEEDDCKFNFYTVWSKASVADMVDGLAALSGGQILAVHGYGFSRNASFYCNLYVAPCPDGTCFAFSQQTAPARPVNTSYLECILPEWDFLPSQRVAHLSLVMSSHDTSSYDIPKIGANVSLQFVTAWSSVRPSWSPSKGGAEIELSGAGFDISTNYTCRFRKGSQQYDSSPHSILASAIRCFTPAVPGSSATFSLSILDGSGSALASFGMPGPSYTEAYFKYRTGWDKSIRESSFTSGPASGNTTLRFAGYGFSSTVEYLCKTYNADGSMYTRAEVVSSVELKCVSPPWGLHFEADEVLVDIIEQIDGVNSSIAFTLGGSDIVVQNHTICRLDDCAFRFHAVWAILLHSSGSAVGGDHVVVKGYGFSTANEGSNCIFSDGNHTQVGGNLKNISVTDFKCAIPKWTGPETNFYHGRMSSVFSVVGVARLGSGPTAFQFSHGWERLNTSTALARGGSSLLVSGAGFSADSQYAQYTCVFKRANFSISSIAVVQSSHQILCKVPEWPRASGEVIFLLDYHGVEVPASQAGAKIFAISESWYSFSPEMKSWSSKGGDQILIVGNGFHAGAAYICRFVDVDDNTMSTQAAALNSTCVSCTTPAWGLFHASGKVSILVLGSSGSELAFSPDGSTTIEANTALTSAYEFGSTLNLMPAWNGSAVTVRHLAAAGGEGILVSGFGLRLGKSYTCVLISVDDVWRNATSDDAEVLGPSELLCTSPIWEYPHGNVTLALFENGNKLPLVTSTPSRLNIYQVYLSFSPSSGSAHGGTAIFVRGHGFSSSDGYSCVFGDDTSQATVLSSSAIRCTLPQLLVSARMVNFTISSLEGILEHKRPLGPWGSKVYAPAAQPLFSYFEEWVSHSPGFADRLGNSASGLKVTGHGFGVNRQYICRFEMDGNPPMFAESSVAWPIDSSTLAFDTPEWDLVTQAQGTSYLSQKVNMSIYQRDGSSGQWNKVFSKNGTSTAGQVPIYFVQINRPPTFAGVDDVRIPMSSIEKPYSFHGWATSIKPSNLNVSIENLQTVTFRIVMGSSAGIFVSAPTVSSDGTLAFKIRAEAQGEAYLRVYLQDDGGTAYGGLDTSDPKLISISVYPIIRTPYIVPLPVIEVLESSSSKLLADFVAVRNTTQFIGVASQEISFTVACPPDSCSDFFQDPPILTVDRALQFHVKPFVFGPANVTVTMRSVIKGTLVGSAAFREHTDVENFTISIIPVNQAPAILINASLDPVEVLEDQYARGTLYTSAPNFVSVLRKGPNITNGLTGLDWSESTQVISFEVVGSSPLFQTKPRFTADGRLQFELAENQNGHAEFKVIVHDNGGVDNNGHDTSLPEDFRVIILPVNDRPSFSMFCPTSAGTSFGSTPEKVVCSDACSTDGARSDCTVQITLDQNCAFCDTAVLAGCDFPFVFEPLVTNMRASELNLEDENDQSISFVVAHVSGNLSLFQHGHTLALDAHTGRLSFCLEHDKIGYALFNLTLQDNNGTEYGGVDRSLPVAINVTVRPVNQQPAFDVCCDSHLVVCEGKRDYHVITDFLTNIRKGNLDRSSGLDNERLQAANFSVQPESSDFFTSLPTINASGALFFSVRPGMTGSVRLTVQMRDDGLTENDGIDTSELHHFEITIVNSYVRMELAINTSEISIDSNKTKRAVAWSADKHHNLVSILGITAHSSSNLSVISLKVFATSIDETLEVVRKAGSIRSAVRASLCGAGPCSWKVSFQALKPSLMHCGNVPAFSISNHTITVEQFRYNDSSPFVLPDFIFNVTVPPDSSLSHDGKEQLDLRITPVRYRKPGSFDWVYGDIDYGLFTSGPVPSIVSNCNPLCTSASLTFAQSLHYNGEVEFNISYGSPYVDFVSHAFSINVLPVNGPPVWELNRSIDYICEDSSNASLINLLQHVSPGMRQSDWNQNVSFNVSVIGDDSSFLEIFTQRPYIEVDSENYGTMILHLARDVHGSVALQIQARDDGGRAHGGEDTSESRIIILVIEPSNDAPTFEYNSSLNISVDENCANCAFPPPPPPTSSSTTTTPVPSWPFSSGCRYPFSLESFVHNIRASEMYAIEEASQILQFEVSAIGGDISVFEGGRAPEINASTGELTFCLAQDRNGVAVFSVRLIDNNGTECGGVDASPPAIMAITVSAVNQQPSFEICCEGQLIVKEGEVGLLVYENFVFNVTKGDIDVTSGVDNEADQQASFEVTSEGALFDNFFLRRPAINSSGALSFALRPGISGTVLLKILMTDNGGSKGVNTSEVKLFNLTTVNSYVLATFDVMGVSHVDAVAVGNAVARSYGIFLSFVTVDSISNISANSCHLSVRIESTSIDETLSRAAAPRLEAIRNVIIHVASSTSIASNSTVSNPGGSTRRLFAAPTVVLVSVQSFMMNAGKRPEFFMLNSTIVVESFRWDLSNPFRLSSFIYNITSPKDTPIGSDGTERLTFHVRPLRYRASLSDPWVFSSSSAGLLAVGPELEVNCQPWCTSANLSFAQAMDYNGEVEYSIRMGASEVYANFSIRILLSFSVPPEVFVFENEEESVIERFLSMRFVGNVSSTLDNSVSIIPGTEGWQGLFRTQADEPRLSLGVPYKDLTFNLWTGRNGMLNASIVVSMDGRNATRPFRLVVTAVNSPPVFSLSTSSISVLRDEYFERPLTTDSLITGVLAGPADEMLQNVTFRLEQLTHNDESPVDMFRSNISVNRPSGAQNWSAVLNLYTKQHMSGRSNLTLTLRDDGGISNGGMNRSARMGLSIEVQRVNQAPSFVLTQNITVEESSGFHSIPRFAINISAEPGFESSWPQEITFSLTQVAGEEIWFEQAPHISENGTLQFTVRSFRNGNARFLAMLNDDGGVLTGSCQNSSLVQDFYLTIESIDDSPSFDLVANSITEDEVYSSKSDGLFSYAHFARNISAGHFEDSQNTSFVFVPQMVRLGTNLESTTLEGAQAIPALAELFADPFITLSADGNLSLHMQPLRHGAVLFKVFLVDDGHNLSTTIAARDLKITFRPVNQAPSFVLSTLQLRIPENGNLHLDEFAINISKMR